MKRTQLIMGWIAVVVFYVGWNFFFPGERPAPDAGYVYRGHPWNLSWWPVAPILMFFWYLVCWVNIINEWDRRPVLFFGKYHKTAGPGLCLIEPLLYTTLADIPVQDVVEEIEAVSVQTKDNVSVNLTGLLTYRIAADRVKDAVVEVEDVTGSTAERALSTMVDGASKVDLDHLLGERDAFCVAITAKLKERIAKWGVSVEAFEINGFKINDQEVEQAIAMKARAAKEGEAELTRAGFQKRVATALNEAAQTFNDQGRWLKGMEVLIELTRSAQNNTVLIPTDLVGALAQVGALTQAGAPKK